MTRRQYRIQENEAGKFRVKVWKWCFPFWSTACIIHCASTGDTFWKYRHFATQGEAFAWCVKQERDVERTRKYNRWTTCAEYTADDLEGLGWAKSKPETISTKT